MKRNGVSGGAGDRRRRIGKRVLGGCVALLLPLGLAWSADRLDRAFPPDLARYRDLSVMIVDRDDRLLRAFTAADGSWRFPVASDRVSPLYLDLLKLWEDRRFDGHPGVDPLALVRAVGQAARHGRVLSGASTLTMQAARLLEPRPRTVRSKIIEMVRAIQLERRFGKSRILDIYLTLAPFGGTLEGVRAASLAYFGKEPRVLTPAEAALLVALPQAPGRLRPDRAPGQARLARDRVLDRALEAGLLSPDAVAQAKVTPVPSTRRPFAFHAPHLAERVRRSVAGSEVVATTIDLDLQTKLEALARRELTRHEPETAMAALIVDNQGREIRAYVGGADFFDARRGGMIDLVRAVRSPGSALKPFVYALAFDRLIVHPRTRIRDAPRRFGDYAPQNFDGGFHGDITVGEALRRSLNVPTVALFERLGPLRFERALDRVGIRLHLDRRSEGPSLALALGGVGSSLEDLVTLYGAFSHDGTVAPLAMSRDGHGSSPDPPRLMGSAAAWYVSGLLGDTVRPPGFADPVLAGDARRIAFKTGTSYGFRDAWAIGFTERFTIGVWIGRPDGAPCSGCTGLDAAAPVLFRAFDLVPRTPDHAPRRPPPGVIDGPFVDLPPALRSFDPVGDGVAITAAPSGTPVGASLRITFPPDGSTVSVSPTGDGPILLPLKAEGGRRPLRWVINGVPVAERDWRRGSVWRPDGDGYASVRVLDAEGNVARAEVYLTRQEPR